MGKLLYDKKNPGNSNVSKFIMNKLHNDPGFKGMPLEAQKEFEDRVNYGRYDLTDEELPVFDKWMSDNNNSYWDAASYDPVVAFKAELKKGADGHTGDLGKKPAHPTFSNEAIYHEKDYNEHERGGGGAWVNTPNGKSYFAPSGTNMHFANGFRDYEGTEGLRGRMNSQGDFYSDIVKLPESNRQWDQEAADQENAMIRDYTGMDFDNPENSTGPLSADEITGDSMLSRSGRKVANETSKRTAKRREGYYSKRSKARSKRQGGILYKI